ncbi:MAG: hypothetical protein BWY47_00783 [Bacteroidetes bacterium ADurb.Bin302]|nr:MAG: hypothetical protein BWY47_00783 [Bacteroidetes bacterium ADurb.Bin302]
MANASPISVHLFSAQRFKIMGSYIRSFVQMPITLSDSFNIPKNPKWLQEFTASFRIGILILYPSLGVVMDESLTK